MSDIPLTEFDIAGLLDHELRKLEPRAQKVLARRFFADEPATLQELGSTFGVGREWVRQIQARSRVKIAMLVEPGGQLNVVCIAIREAIGVVLPLEVLLSLFPGLSRPVEAAECVAWRVIERLDKSFEVRDNWCACPSISAAQALTLSSLNRATDAAGMGKIDAIESLGREFAGPAVKSSQVAWLEYCGCRVRGNHVFIR